MLCRHVSINKKISRKARNYLHLNVIIMAGKRVDFNNIIQILVLVTIISSGEKQALAK